MSKDKIPFFHLDSHQRRDYYSMKDVYLYGYANVSGEMRLTLSPISWSSYQ